MSATNDLDLLSNFLSFASTDGISEGQTAAQNSAIQTKFTEGQHEFSVPFYYTSHNLETGI